MIECQLCNEIERRAGISFLVPAYKRERGAAAANRTSERASKRPACNQRARASNLNVATSIALTFDMWSSRDGHGFGGLQGHFIDEAGTLSTETLEFRRLIYPHDGAAMSKFLGDAIKKFDIANKIIAITTDSASSNVSAIELMDASLNLDVNFPTGLTHYRCACHILNLAVKEALDEIKPLVVAIRSFVLAIRSSPKRAERFEVIQREIHQENIRTSENEVRQDCGEVTQAESTFKALRLVEDCATRWNSTYLMLQRAYRLRESVDGSRLVMSDIKNTREIDWAQLQQVIIFLGPFFELTEDLSGENYPTLPLVNACTPALIKHLKETDFIYPEIKRAATAALGKLEDYGRHMEQAVASMATILDPRFKLKPYDSAIHPILKDMVRRNIGQTFETTSNDPQLSCFRGVWSESSAYELTAYLGSPPEPRVCDVPLFWKLNEAKYPELSKLARRILNIQATSVACERIFSRAGLVDEPLRSQLSDESFRSNMLLNAWLVYLEL